MDTSHSPATLPQTQAVRHFLACGVSDAALADLMFLEAWELDPAPGLATTRRIGQIRRAQPGLAAAIRSELEDRRRPSKCHGNDTSSAAPIR